jgi:hypothetical protein
LGAEESVSVLREGELCAWKSYVVVVYMDFGTGYVMGKYQIAKHSAFTHLSIPKDELVLIDPMLYPLYGYERKDDEGVAREYRIW